MFPVIPAEGAGRNDPVHRGGKVPGNRDRGEDIVEDLTDFKENYRLLPEQKQEAEDLYQPPRQPLLGPPRLLAPHRCRDRRRP